MNTLLSHSGSCPKTEDGGIYVIEDTNTSYWPEYGGDSNNLDNPSTSMNFFKKLTDCLNHREFLIAGYKPTYFDENIVAIHFYHNIIFLYKGKNDENQIFQIIRTWMSRNPCRSGTLPHKRGYENRIRIFPCLGAIRDVFFKSAFHAILPVIDSFTVEVQRLHEITTSAIGISWRSTPEISFA